ncbi:hypothetical protein QK899_15310 [Pseudomonas sp. AR5]|nr:hypothetical protein QK899_15310 [Pseudomonas sp. AR5]
MIVDAYIEAAGQLHSAGLAAPIVFTSSNTKEYFAPNTRRLQDGNRC